MTDASTFRFSPRPNRAHLIRWRHWGAAAFDEAASQDKLIVLVLTAFWCGICQRLDETTLSSADVHLLLNAYFVAIRVEDNERPDVDLRYSHEGWPTIVFLSPQAAPILTVNALTEDQLSTILVRLVDVHDQNPAAIAEPPPPLEPLPTPNSDWLTQTTVDDVVHLLCRLADSTDGGFGSQHKYFYSDALTFFLHLARRTADGQYLLHVRLTLDTLIERAIYDRADGGFFRYSSKPDWNEPHREKLLVDQADLLQIYVDAYELTAEPMYRATAEGLIAYLDQVLSLDGGPLLAGCQDLLQDPEAGGWTSIVDPFVYCDANAHAASAYFAAARVLGQAECSARGERIVDELWARLRAPAGGMYHFSPTADGPAHAPGLLTDSVAMGLALLDGYQAIGSSRLLERATLLGREILRLHLNPAGGLFDISQPGPAALQRPVMVLTQNAAAAKLFLRLARASGDVRFHDAARWALLSYDGSAEVYGAYAASFGHALDLYLQPARDDAASAART